MSYPRSILVKVDRDSVCMGDDVESHETSIEVPGDVTAGDLVQAALRACKLPSIAGGRATWIVRGGAVGVYLAVAAQQWREPRLLLEADARVRDLLDPTKPALRFQYWCQRDPEEVFDAIRLGRKLPSRYAAEA